MATIFSGKILVIANSARMLAQFLWNAGFEVLVIDRFADLDTREAAFDFIQVPTLALEDIKTAVNEMLNRHRFTQVIYGSGFEKYCSSVKFLESCLTVLGNNSVTFGKVQDKAAFFEQLNQLSIDYPEVSFQAPQDSADWLSKPLQGEGGSGVSWYSKKQENGRQVYWQRYIEGEPMSVLFVAADGKVGIAGFQLQLKEAQSSNREFVFSGVITQPNLPGYHHGRVVEWATKLAACFQLTGLNGLDFIIKDDRCYVLEINARPTASLQLYDNKLIKAHINACLGEWSEFPNALESLRAYKIVYAKVDLVIRPDINWPDWSMDRPLTGSIIGQGEPICSIMALAKTSQQLLNCLQLRQQTIEYYIYR